ncbi:MAG: L,D-transpeptidase family protein [Bacteroidetes bacterium]|nr:L,D-transpeptidase family protein [Bacteroidota bacterium]MBS1932157.1 L,D-transpeptidase family protein [Bacteroidota bacterium]
MPQRPKPTMSKVKFSFPFFIYVLWIFVNTSCNNSRNHSARDIASSPKELQQKASTHIADLIKFAKDNGGKIDDSTELKYFKPLISVYEECKHKTVWSMGEEWLPIGDSMYHFIANAKLYGLFPQDYHFTQLSSIYNRIFNDSNSNSDRKDATLWAKADLMLTDAFFHIVKDVKLGRLPQDSITLRKDSALTDVFYVHQFDTLMKTGALTATIHKLEPKIAAYDLLKQGIKKFLENYDDKVYTVVPSPTKNKTKYKELLQKRLYEGGFIATDSIQADSVLLSQALKKFQETKGIETDGKIGNETLIALNTSDKERFVRIAITMDKFKMLPSEMPEQYIWVNLPAFSLQVWKGDSIEMRSRIVCGKPATRSPVLTSAIAELITYPKWTIPASIIEKEILPGVKKNPKYFQKKGYGIYDSKGKEINPDSVDWKKYNKGIPYHVVQGSGDANALGVLKFNFSNKYAVYLHDTNERYLFSRNDRAMSHGCIRVQAWQQLADFVVNHDNSDGKALMRLDSIQLWLKKKQKHSISIRNKMPLFIRYYTCQGENGNVVFYNDIYGEDKKLAEKYFTGK